MGTDRLDLSVFDPAADEVHWERRVRGILTAAEAELGRRRALHSPIALVAGWARPVLSAAAVLVMISGSAFVFAQRNAGIQPEPGPQVAESLQLPETVGDWLAADRPPAVSDLVLALEGDWQ
jgi:hypothetical protein